MKNNRTTLCLKKSNFFTMFELLISVGLLVILSVVLLRTFALTADYWRKSDEQSSLQADAKTVFNMLSSELNNIIYQTPAVDNDTFHAPILIDNNNRRICFVTHSRLQDGLLAEPRGTVPFTDICKVSYQFTAPSGGSSGVLRRYYAGDQNHGQFNFTSTAAGTYYPDPLGTPSTPAEAVVINNVLDFNVTAYNASSNTVSPANIFTSDNVRYIRVRLELMPENRFAEYDDIANTADREAFRAKYARIFYKTFYIKPMNQ